MAATKGPPGLAALLGAGPPGRGRGRGSSGTGKGKQIISQMFYNIKQYSRFNQADTAHVG